MGGLQSYQWGAIYPDMVERIAPFCGAAKTWSHNYVVLNGLKASLTASVPSNKLNQLTSENMRTVGSVYAGWGLSQAFFRKELYRELGCESIEDFVGGILEDSFMKMNPHNFLTMLWTGQNADISDNPIYKGNFEEALSHIKAHAYVMPAKTDLFCTADDNEYEAKHIPNSTYLPIESIWGHFAGRGINDVDNKFIDHNLKSLLALSANI